MNADPSAAAFWSDGYRIVDTLLSPKQCAFLRQCMDLSQRNSKMRMADNGAYRGPNNEYAPTPAHMLLHQLAPTFSGLVGQTLLPTFSFWRIYEAGAVLNPHKDRNACEVSVTISLASEPCNRIWPIGVTDLHGEDHHVALTVGMGLLYQGLEVQHWRERLTDERHYQMFLHYVVADGPFASSRYDGATERDR